MNMTRKWSDVERRDEVGSSAARNRAVRRQSRRTIGREIASLAMLAAVTILLATLSAICLDALTARASAHPEAGGIGGTVRGSLSVPLEGRRASLSV